MLLLGGCGMHHHLVARVVLGDLTVTALQGGLSGVKASGHVHVAGPGGREAEAEIVLSILEGFSTTIRRTLVLLGGLHGG